MQALYNFLHKNGIAVAFGLALVAAVTSITMISIHSIPYNEAYVSVGEKQEIKKIADPEAKNELQRKEAKSVHLKSQQDGVGTLIVWGFVLVFLGALGALVFPLLKSLDDPKSILKFVGSLVVVLLVFGISYVVADTVVVGTSPDRYTSGEARFSGAIVGSIFVFVGLAVAGMVGGEVYRIIKERN